VYAYVLHVPALAAFWVGVTVAHNFLGWSRWGFTKDLCMAGSAVAQLCAAWQIGESPGSVGWEWIGVLTVQMF
jgi:hypothetical protein